MKTRIKTILVNLELIIMSIIVIVPVSWIVLSSFNKGTSLATSTFIPKQLTFENYRRLFQETNFTTWFSNTFQIATLNAIISVFLILITAWVLSRFQFKGKSKVLSLCLSYPCFLAFYL